MATPVSTVTSGGIPVVDVSASKPGLGKPVSEAPAGRGTPVVKVASGGIAVAYVTPAVGGLPRTKGKGKK